jgi:acyl-CoA thioester hydrolase
MHEVRCSFKAMTYDIDFAGVVSNITYTRWLEDLRNLFAEQTLSVGDAFKRGIAPALTRTEIDFLAPVRFPDTVNARMWLDELGPARWVLAAEFTSEATGTVAVRARQTGLFVSLQTFRPVPLPEEYR